MDLVAELSQDIAKEYRQRQKSKLQRTFVKASDAASSKVKGTSKNCEFSHKYIPNKNPMKYPKNAFFLLLKTKCHIFFILDAQGLKTPPSESGPNNHNVSTSKMNFVASQETIPCKKIKIDNQPYGQIIVMQHPEESPTAVIQKSAAISKANLEYKIEKKDNC